MFKLFLYLFFFCFNCFASVSSDIQVLIKKYNILSFMDENGFDETRSKDIIDTINGKWNKENIHLVTLFNPMAKDYKDVLDNNIKLLIEKLQEATTITTYKTAKYYLPARISEAIIKKMKDQWDKNNIHLVTLFNPMAKDYKDVLDNNIKLLIEKLQEETTITTYQKGEYFLPARISEAIIKKMKDQWDKNNIHILTLLDPLSNSIIQIDSLIKVKNSVGLFDLQKKYEIRRRVNLLLSEGNFQEEKSEGENDKWQNHVCYADAISPYNDLDISYVGMRPLEKLILSSGILSGSIGLGAIFMKYRKISPLVSKIILAGFAVTVLVPIVINEINRHKDKKYYLPIRQKNLDKLKLVLSQKASN